MKEGTNKNNKPSEKNHYTFPKKERICSKKTFDYLFTHGQKMKHGPLRCIYIFNPPDELIESPVSVAFSVPKRLLKRAVDRNYIKRRLREGFRLHKHSLLSTLNKEGNTLAFIIIYTKPYKIPYHSLISSFTKLLKRFQEI